MDEKNSNFEQKEEGRPPIARRLFLVIVILAFFGLIGGFWSIKTAIEQPLAFTNSNTLGSGATTGSLTDSDEAVLLQLKSKDTDQDGLSDYVELYTHGSSPYLSDSDSDGIADKTEIDNGDDPNCPSGTTCTPIAVFSPSQTTNTNSSQQGTQSVDVAQLRTTLRNAGAPQAELDALSDAELIALYQDVLVEEGGTNTNSGIGTIDVTELRDLTAEEIRELLLLGGADQETLNQIDDETLRAIFLESVQNISATQ